MKHKKLGKWIVIVILMIVFAGVLSGCSKTEIEVDSTIDHQVSINSLENEKAQSNTTKDETNKIETKVNEDGTTEIVCTTKEPGEEYTIYQLPMMDNAGGAGYAIALPSGKLVMIDGGYQLDGDYIHDFIVEHGGVVESWFITHPHFDHAGGLLYNLEQDFSDISIEKIYYSPFTQEFVESKEAQPIISKETESSFLFNQFEAFRTSDNSKQNLSGIEYIPVKVKDQISVEGMQITCMNSFDENLPDINGNSLALHFDMNGITMLITGDITDASIENMVALFGEDNSLWNVDFLQIPHHGYMAGISNDRLYQLTRPNTAFLDCATSEYETDAVQIKEHMEWLENLNINIVKRFEGINKIVIH